jgi:hypothetical protein
MKAKPKGKSNAAARTLGHFGGLKGGPARARALSGSQRTRISKHAANMRWGKKTSYTKPQYYKRATKPYPARP